jgi:hypothetical protein
LAIGWLLNFEILSPQTKGHPDSYRELKAKSELAIEQEKTVTGKIFFTGVGVSHTSHIGGC